MYLLSSYIKQKYMISIYILEMNDYHGLFQHQSSYSVWKSAAVAEKNEGNSSPPIGYQGRNSC